MRMPKRGEKGFTLIELLIVVAILGVLAAVIIPNVSRFFGSGEEEARKTEKSSVQLAVGMMLSDNDLSATPNNTYPDSGATATNNMSLFPDSTSLCEGDKVTDPQGHDYVVTTDEDGYILYGHDITGSEVGNPNPDQTDINYLPSQYTDYYYTVDASGTVHQYETDDTSLGEL